MSPQSRPSASSAKTPFSKRLQRFLDDRYGENVRGAKRKLAISLGRVAANLPAEPDAHANRRERRDDGLRALDYSPAVSEWIGGRVPGTKLITLLSNATGKSIDYWLNGTAPASLTETSWADVDVWVLEGLMETMPLQSHAVYEYRALMPLAMRLAERLPGSRATNQRRRAVYRRAGRLLGETLAAPLHVLGVAGLPPHEQRTAQGYLVAAAGAASLLVDFAAPSQARRVSTPTRKSTQRRK